MFPAAGSGCTFHPFSECVLRLFSVVLLIVASEEAAAGEAHSCSRVAIPAEPLAGTMSRFQQ